MTETITESTALMEVAAIFQVNTNFCGCLTKQDTFIEITEQRIKITLKPSPQMDASVSI